MNEKEQTTNNLVIRAHGIGFFVLLFIYLLFPISAISLFISFFIPSTDAFHNITILILAILTILFFSIEIINLFKKGKVIFHSDIFECNGQYTKYFPKFKKRYSEFKSFKLLSKFGAQCVEFTFTNDKKVLFHTMQFSKNQIKRIVSEIKYRGGFMDCEIQDFKQKKKYF